MHSGGWAVCLDWAVSHGKVRVTEELEALRTRIAAIDREVLRLAAERLDLAGRVGRAKRAAGLPVRSFGTEAEVLARYRAEADDLGLEAPFAEAIAGTLIAAAVRRQEEEGLAAVVRGGKADPGSMLIVGGAGKMGQWLVRFFAGQGHQVSTFDPGGSVSGVNAVSDLSAARDADVVILAMPLSRGPEVLREVLALEPRGLVADISSLKSHLVDDLKAGAARGLRVASLHPLFGPGVRTLAGRIMAVCDCGHRGAAEDAAALFRDTALTVTRLPVERHDGYMQFVLGLSHLMSVLFATTLDRSGLTFDDLATMASTTFYKQARTAAEVVGENAIMYYEIQRLNRHSGELYDLVVGSLREVARAALADDPAAFERLMGRGREWFPASVPADLG